MAVIAGALSISLAGCFEGPAVLQVLEGLKGLQDCRALQDHKGQKATLEKRVPLAWQGPSGSTGSGRRDLHQVHRTIRPRWPGWAARRGLRQEQRDERSPHRVSAVVTRLELRPNAEGRTDR
jgi:hypothetical protein